MCEHESPGSPGTEWRESAKRMCVDAHEGARSVGAVAREVVAWPRRWGVRSPPAGVWPRREGPAAQTPGVCEAAATDACVVPSALSVQARVLSNTRGVRGCGDRRVRGCPCSASCFVVPPPPLSPPYVLFGYSWCSWCRSRCRCTIRKIVQIRVGCDPCMRAPPAYPRDPASREAPLRWLCQRWGVCLRVRGCLRRTQWVPCRQSV